MSSALLWVWLLANRAAGVSQWRLLHQDGSVTALAGDPLPAAAATAGAGAAAGTGAARLRAVWVWTVVRAPQRLDPAELAALSGGSVAEGAAAHAAAPGSAAETAAAGATAAPPGSAFAAASQGRLEVNVVRPANLRAPDDLRLIAAPLAMWQELPEDALPSWPVPASTRVVLPAEGTRPWRIRVAGAGEGSFWQDARPGTATAVATRPAPGIDLAVEDAGGAPLGRAAGLVRDGPERLRRARLLANVRGAGGGRLVTPGLPDGEEVTLDVVVPGFEPAVLQGWPSALPHRLRLRPGSALHGQVADAALRPLAGVSVSVEAWARSGDLLLTTKLATTDARGEWSVDGVPRGRIALTLRKRGYVPSVERFDLPADGASGAGHGAGSPIDLGRRQLERGVSLAVLLRDSAGPLPGARVSAGPALAAVAGDDGVAVLAGVPTSALTLSASADRHQAASLQLNPPFPPRAVLTLPRAFTAVGRFVDGSGAPVAGGTAEVEMPGCVNRTRLAEDGSFSVTLVPERAATLTLSGPRVRERRTGLAPGAAGEVRDLGDLTAPPGLDVTGRVLSAQDSAAVAGARVWLPRPGGAAGPVVAWASGDLLEATTDEAGRFRLTGLDVATAAAGAALRLRIDAAGFARGQADLAPAAAAAMAAAGGGAAPGNPAAGDSVSGDGVIDLGDIALAAGARLHILVRPSGRPSDASLEGATARVDLGNQWSDPDMLQAEVRDGEAVIPNVPPGTVTVTVLAGRTLVCDRQVTVGGEAGDMEVDCARKTMTVSGTVRLGGVPSGAGALVWRAAGALAAPPGDAQIDSIDSPAGLRQQQVFGLGRPQVDTPVDAGSSFVTQDLTPGTWSVAWMAGAGTLSGAVAVEIPDADPFATTVTFPGLAVSGVVTGKDGRPAAGARVRDLGSGDLAQAGADGTFTLGGLAPGRVTLQAQLGDLRSHPLRLDLAVDGAGAGPVTLVVGDDSVDIAIRVATAAGAPISGAFVFLEEQGAGVRVVTTGADGTATAGLDGAAPAAVRAATYAAGLWTFGPWTPTDQAQQQGLALAADAPGHGTLLVTSAQGVPVRLVTADGWDLSWLYQMLGAPLQTQPGKPLALDGLPAGSYAVTPGSGGAAVVVTVPEQGAVEARVGG